MFEISNDFSGDSIEFHIVELNQDQMKYSIIKNFDGLLHLRFEFDDGI